MIRNVIATYYSHLLGLHGMNDVQIEYLNLYSLQKVSECVQFTAIANLKVCTYILFGFWCR